MLIEEHMNGPTKVKIYDDFIRSPKESEEIMERVVDNMLRQINAQKNASKDKTRRDKP